MRWTTRLASAALVACLSAGAMAAGDPSIHEVYQTAERGQVAQAQQMMEQVLKDHPNSGKAHYVEAELLARQGLLERARNELAQADKLAPGLPFAKPAAVTELRAKLAPPAQSSWAPAVNTTPAAVSSTHAGLPWGWIIAALGVLALVWGWMRSRASSAAYAPANPVPAGGSFGGNYGGAGYAPYGATPYPNGPVPGAGGGLGSQMLGGLATGAAVGAGVVAGEALMHRILDDDKPRHNAASTGLTDLSGYDVPMDRISPPSADYDMGGHDFGLNDAGSWDDGGASSSSDDWN